MTRHLTKTQRNRARELRTNMTNAERMLWNAIRRQQLGPKFRKQSPLGPYIVDFLSYDPKLVIEVDGGQHAMKSEYEQTRVAFIQSKGFHLLRFWNSDVMANLQGVLESIVHSLPPPNLPPKMVGGTRDITSSTFLLDAQTKDANK